MPSTGTRRLYDKNPDYVPADEQPPIPLRREYAGVLLKAGRVNSKYYDEAKEVLQGRRQEDVEARRMLAAAYLLKGRSIATDPQVQEVRRKTDEDREYDEAEKVAESLAELRRAEGRSGADAKRRRRCGPTSRWPRRSGRRPSRS